MRVGTSVISFLFFSLLARKWGAVSLGEFSTLFTVFMFLWQMPLLGLHIVISRNIAASPETAWEQATNALVLSLAVSLVMIAIVGLFGQWLYPESLHASFWLIGVSTVFMGMTSVAEAVLIGQERMQIIAWANIGENIFRVLLGLLLVLMGYGLTAVVGAFVLARLVAVGVYLKAGGLGQYVGKDYWSRDVLREFVKKCPTFFGILFLSVMVGRVDFIVLSLMVPMREVGMYSPSFKIYEIGLMVPSMVTVVIFPAFSRCFKAARGRFDGLYLNVFGFAIAFGVPLVILLANSSSFLIGVIFGEQYVEGSLALQLLAVAILFVALDQILTAVTLAAHREDLEVRILVTACSIYLALLFALIPLYSYVGAAIATVVATFVKLVVRYIWIRKALDIPGAMDRVYRPAIAIIPLILLLFFLHDLNIFLVSFLGLCVYLGVLFAVKGITKSQLLSFKQALAGN